jgi:hypothetical protein
MLTDEQIEYWANLLRYVSHNGLDQHTLAKVCMYMTGSTIKDAAKIIAKAKQLDGEAADIITQAKYN